MNTILLGNLIKIRWIAIFGQILAIFVLTVAAAESSIGLAILVTYYRVRGSVTIESVNLLKG